MSLNTIKSMMKKTFSFLLVGALFLPSSTVYALNTDESASAESERASSFPVLPTSYLSATEMKSINEHTSRTEIIKIPHTSGQSMWFNDGIITRPVVRTYNNPDVRHVTGGKVEIYVRQEGHSGVSTLINGSREPLNAETVESVMQPNIQYTTTRYTINYRALADPDEPYTIFTAETLELTNPGGNVPYTRFETNVYIYWDKSNLPAAPNVSFKYDSAAEKMVLSGANSKMEYRLKNAGPDAWQPCTDTPMYFTPTDTQNATYFVRYSEVGNTKASQVQEVVLPGKRVEPSVSYDAASETFEGLSSALEIQFGDGSYTPLTDSTLKVSDVIDTIPTDNTLSVNIRQKATETYPAGVAKNFTLYSRAATPTSVVFDPASISLTGCNSTMEYRTDTETSWHGISGSTVNLAKLANTDNDVIVYVRTKPTSKNAASKSVQITIPKLLEGPIGTLEYDNERITGLESGNYQYSLNGMNWSDFKVTDNTWNISSLINNSARTIYLRKAATSTTPITAHTIFEVPARRPAPTTPVFVYNDATNEGKAVLTGLAPEMEYRAGSSDTWKPVTSTNLVMDIPSTTTYYQVRYKATSDSFCSTTKHLTLLRAGNAPSFYYNTTTELLTGLNDRMEIKIGTGSYTPIETGVTTYNMSTPVNDLSSGSTLTVAVRTKATETEPASLDRVITLYPRLAEPTNVVFNSAPLTLTGCTAEMQYRVDSDSETYWRYMSGNTLKLEQFASAERDVVIYVRMKPTATASASKTVQFTIPMLVPGPTGTIDYANESITQLDNGSYQYSTDKTNWTTTDVTNGSCDISSLITGSVRTIYLRKNATTTAPITAYTAFELPRRPSSPTTPKFIYDDVNNPDKIIFSGLTTDMEYRKSTDDKWTAVPASGLIFDPQDKAITYHVRNMATTDTWASAYMIITLAAKPVAPSIYYNKETETLSNLGPAYEISFDGSTYTALTSYTYNISAQIDNIPPNGSLVVSVRYRASSYAPAGHSASITVYARGSQLQDISEIEDVPVTTPEIEDVPVSTPDIEDVPVSTPDIEDVPVSTPDIEDVPVTTPEIEDVPVTTPEIEDVPVTAPDIEDVPVTTPDIEDVPVTTPDIEGSL